MKQDEPGSLTSVNFRLATEEIRKLALLGVVYGNNRTRALSVAIDRLYQATLTENAVFGALVVAGVAPSDDDPAPADL